MSKEIQKLNSPFAPNGAPKIKHAPVEHVYIDVKLVDKVVKTGEGDDEFIVVTDAVFDKTPVQEVIDVDKDKVGVYAIIKQFLRTGDQDLIPRDDGKCSVDLVGAPHSILEAAQLGDKTHELFGKIPAELKGDMSIAQFVESMSQEKFDAFVKAIADRSSKKVEVKKDGE